MLPTGGSGEALEKVKPVLLCFAANAVLVGDSGAGNALKLLNQMMFSLHQRHLLRGHGHL